MRWRLPGTLRVGTLLLAGACCLTAQSKKPQDLAVGKILVTPRDSPDPLFEQSVILLVRYSESEALGLVVNRRTTVPVSNVLRAVHGAAGHSDPVFVGGPVELNAVFALARAGQKPAGADEVSGDIYFISARDALEKALGVPANPAALRVYLGYCGWGPHQLENEARLGGWYIFDHSQDLAFDATPATLWSRLVAQAEARIARADGVVRQGR